MPSSDPLAYLQSVLSRDFTAEQYAAARKKRERQPLIITVSRDYGALGELVAQALAETIGIPLYDQEILDLVAKRAKTDKFFIQAHDEQANDGFASFLYSIVSGSTATLQSYRRHLYEVILGLARKDCVIVGRGAHLILTGKPIFRVRIVGTRSVCARRIAEELAIPLPEAEKKVFEINNKRHQSILNLFKESFPHCSLEHPVNFDLTINTDQIPAVGATPLILLAMQQSGFDMQPCDGTT